MVEPLSVNTDGVRALRDIHKAVATSLESLAADAPGSAEFAISHGTIASGVNRALTATLDSRAGSMIVTQSSAESIAELLQQAALSYEQGDRRGAESIEATARDAGPATGGPRT